MARKPPRGATGVQIGEAQARGMIIQGGLMVFADKGTRAASVEDILAAGRISRRTFYRLFTGKDDVMLAIYKLGTDRLIDACRAAVASEPDPVKQVHRFVEAHLMSARMLGRIVFVLGGEAARQESPLHAYRMEAHGKLVELLLEKHPDADPLLLRGVLLALEGATRLMLEECDQGRKVTDAAVKRCRAVMLRIATATMVGEGPGVTPIPTKPPAA